MDYAPSVDVRAVKAKRRQDEAATLSGAVAETLKYAVKPADMVADAEWFLEMTRQLHKKRFVATGGALKDVFRLGEETGSRICCWKGRKTLLRGRKSH